MGDAETASVSRARKSLRVLLAGAAAIAGVALLMLLSRQLGGGPPGAAELKACFGRTFGEDGAPVQAVAVLAPDDGVQIDVGLYLVMVAGRQPEFVQARILSAGSEAGRSAARDLGLDGGGVAINGRTRFATDRGAVDLAAGSPTFSVGTLYRVLRAELGRAAGERAPRLPVPASLVSNREATGQAH